MSERAALVVAHPGHELRVFGWLVETAPVVHVLTDGSGRGAPRLSGTEELVRGAGAARGEVFGRFADREAYGHLLAGRLEPFVSLARDLAAAFGREGTERVVADARDGYNPMHDVCRHVAEAAARLHGVRCDAFSLVGDPREERGEGVRVLSDALLARKLAAARAYVGLEGEVEEALAAHGAEAFRREWIGPSRVAAEAEPFYERHGARRVAEGSYAEVIRYGAHVRPLEERLAAL